MHSLDKNGETRTRLVAFVVHSMLRMRGSLAQDNDDINELDRLEPVEDEHDEDELQASEEEGEDLLNENMER